jgi:AcrR family transcriptional regulator
MTTDPAAGTPSGLRERKKQATRSALSWAALRLAVQHGLENVRVEEIAAAAGVSPRTFNNYFSSKYEAIIHRHLDRTRQAAAALRERPTGEPLWTAITEAVLLPYGTPDESPGPEWTAGVRRMLAEPALQGEFARVAVDARTELARAIAQRTGTDADRDLYPNLAAAAVLTASRVAGDQWLRHDPPVPLTVLLREALGLIATGLPDPSSPTPS